MKQFLLPGLFITLLLTTAKIYGQTTLPIPRNIQAAYQKGTRSKTGSPGKNYWQNSADYAVKINFTPKTRLLAGSETITYYNNSLDTLHQIWFKLYPNLYERGAPRESPIHPEDITPGVHIGKIVINGKTQNARKRRIRGTNMIVGIPPLPPHQNIKFTVHFSYTLNEHSQIRTGEVEPGAYFIAYFMPRIAVYDDIDGWDKFPYNGLQEFYNDFCNFDVQITVPKKYVIWATGTLQNGSEVLEKKYNQRIKQAKKHNHITTVIDTTDLKEGDITANHSANTWHFSAKNVTEFAFATSNHYVWKSTSLVVDPKTQRRVRVDAVFNPEHKDYDDVIHFARKTVKAMSYRFPKWPYPYPHETVFDGLSQMEYPMMVNDNPLNNRAESIELTDHEIFHTMFPFYMGTNETKYAWMDEGWATIAEWLISPVIDSTVVDYYGMLPYDHAAGTEDDLPIMTPSTQETGAAYYLNSYPKPAMGYLYVKDMLGDSLFLKGLHHYIKLWHGKHPMPYDFFYSMNEGTGKNLNWFWKRWFFDRGFPDQAIKKVIKRGKKYRVAVKSIGSKPVPVDLTVTYKNGSTQKLHRNISVWKEGNRTVQLSFKPKGKVVKITLGAPHDADIDSTNNTFMMQ
jgi:hypothetical protein